MSLNRASFSCPEAEVRGLFIHKGIVFAPKLYGRILALPSGFYQGRWTCVCLTKALLKSCLKEAVFWEASERICRSISGTISESTLSKPGLGLPCQLRASWAVGFGGLLPFLRVFCLSEHTPAFPEQPSDRREALLKNRGESELIIL